MGILCGGRRTEESLPTLGDTFQGLGETKLSGPVLIPLSALQALRL